MHDRTYPLPGDLSVVERDAVRLVVLDEDGQMLLFHAGDSTSYRRHRLYSDRILFTDHTDGGKRATIVARYDAGRRSIRPITAWEEP